MRTYNPSFSNISVAKKTENTCVQLTPSVPKKKKAHSEKHITIENKTKKKSQKRKPQ